MTIEPCLNNQDWSYPVGAQFIGTPPIMNIGVRVGWSGWVGLYGRPSCLVCTRRKVLSPRQFWGTHTSRGAVRPGTRKGPSTPNPTPCHYMLSIPAPTPVGPSPGGGAVSRYVVARGGRAERWGPCGCQAWEPPQNCRGERSQPPSPLRNPGPISSYLSSSPSLLSLSACSSKYLMASSTLCCSSGESASSACLNAASSPLSTPLEQQQAMKQ